MSLHYRFLQHFQQIFGPMKGQRLAVAVSGGMDSVVLLDLLWEVRRALGVRLVVAHVDHGLRGAASAADAAFVRSLASQRGLPCYCGRFHSVAGRGLEDAARRERLAFLRGVPASAVVLAHHLDDQAETVLLRLLRSSSPRGLGGMAPRRGPFLRPLLGFSRRDLHRWASDRQLHWREDASNADLQHERNRLRHDVMPALEAVHGGLVARLSALAAEQRGLLDALAVPVALAAGDVLLRADLEPLPQAQRAALLRAHASARMGCTGLDRDAVLRADGLARTGRPGAWTPLPWGWRFAACAQRLYCLPPPPQPRSLGLTGVRRWGVHTIATQRLSLDAESVGLRAPLPGERFGGQPLEEWLRRRGVPAPLRPYHPVFHVGERVLWVPGGHPLEGLVALRGLAITVTASIPTVSAPGLPWAATL